MSDQKTPESIILCGDSYEVLKDVPDNSIDAVVTDAPYGLGKEPNAEALLKDWVTNGYHEIKGKGFMGKVWDAFVPQPLLWKEVYRVLKPGGHVLSFFGTRTYDWGVLAMRLAGFEIRDQVQWIYGCYSEDTECFTKNGWIKYDKITPETEVLQWNSETNTLSWTKPLEIIKAPYRGELVNLKNRHTDQLLTPNHRVYTKIQRHSRNSPPTDYEVVEAEELKTYWQKTLPLAGNLKGSVSKPLAYLLGWWMTDAWVRGDGKAAMFSQSKPETLVYLRNALVEAGAKFSEYVKQPKKPTHNAEHTFYVTGDLASYLINEYPKREFGYEVLDWDQKSRLEFLRGLIDGDGTVREGQHGFVFWSKRAERLEVVQALALSLGYRTLVDSEKGCVHINPAHDSTQLQSKHPIERVSYDGMVWCLRVPDGAFLVRRNGKPFISGNSGFPKSHNISKAIDKMHGAEREVIGSRKTHDIRSNNLMQAVIEDSKMMECAYTIPATPDAIKWNGFGTALKPANEPIVLARKPLEKGLSIAENVLKWGCGAINIDGCRVEFQSEADQKAAAVHNAGSSASGSLNWNTGQQKESGKEYRIQQGRFPANIIFDEEAAKLLDEQSGTLTSGKPGIKHKGNTGAAYGKESRAPGTQMSGFGDSGGASRYFKVIKEGEECGSENTKDADTSAGKRTVNKGGNLSIAGSGSNISDRFHLSTISITKTKTHSIMNFQILSASTKTCTGLCTIASERAIESLTESSIESVSFVSNTEALINLANGNQEHIKGIVSLALVNDLPNGERKIESATTLITGNTEKGPLRFRYCAKASKSERNRGLEGTNGHPTVKPISLVEYLIKLITPPNGLVLDPFMGSGTTGIAAKQLGFDFIGIEREPEYVAIAEKRIQAAKVKVTDDKNPSTVDEETQEDQDDEHDAEEAQA